MSTYKLKVNSAKVSGTHTDFPVYVDLSNMPSSFRSKVSNGGGDIRCYSDSALTTQLPREVVTCDTSDDTGELRVKTGLSTTTEIYITVDGSSTEPTASSTYGSENVWNSNYKAVYHMKDANDSTSNGNDGTVVGATSGATGQIGDAYDFDGVNDYIDCGDIGDLGTQYSVSALVNGDAIGGIVAGYRTDDKLNNNNVAIQLGIDYFLARDSSRVVSSASGPTATTGTRYNITGTNDGGDVELYIDGVSAGTSTNTLGTIFMNRLTIGNFRDDDTNSLGNGRLNGKICQVSFKNSIPSSDRVSTEYNNQSDVDTFWTIEDANTQGLMPFFLKG